MARDSHRARAVVERAVEAGALPEAALLDVVAPALREFGELWAHGDVSVAHEHYATGVSEGVIALLAARMRRAPAGGRLAIVGCPTGERHGVAARIIGDLLEAEAWEVIVVGSDVPTRDLVALVADEQPDLVCLSVTMPDRIEQAFETLGALGTVAPRPALVLGGQAWDGTARMADALGADLVVSNPQDLIAWVRRHLP